MPQVAPLTDGIEVMADGGGASLLIAAAPNDKGASLWLEGNELSLQIANAYQLRRVLSLLLTPEALAAADVDGANALAAAAVLQGEIARIG
jgi:hypothetical protein